MEQVKCLIVTIAQQQVSVREVLVDRKDTDNSRSVAKRAYLQANGLEAQATQYDAYRLGNAFEIVHYPGGASDIRVMAEVIVGV